MSSLFLGIVLVCSFLGFSIVKFEVVRAGTVVVGDIVVDTVWDVAGSPYWMEDAVTTEQFVDGRYALDRSGTETDLSSAFGTSPVTSVATWPAG